MLQLTTCLPKRFASSQTVYLMSLKAVRPELWPPFWLDLKPADLPAHVTKGLWLYAMLLQKSWTVPLRINCFCFMWIVLVASGVQLKLSGHPLVFLRKDWGSGAGGQDSWTRRWNLPEGWPLHQWHARVHCGDQRTHSCECLDRLLY